MRQALGNKTFREGVTGVPGVEDTSWIRSWVGGCHLGPWADSEGQI